MVPSGQPEPVPAPEPNPESGPAPQSRRSTAPAPQPEPGPAAAPAPGPAAAPAPEPAPAPAPPPAPAIRASDQDREAVLRRLQLAFAERRLDDDEFDGRMRAALTARTLAELNTLTADLPAVAPGRAPAPVTGASSARFAVSYKSSIRRGGRWKVPARFSPVVYKGSGWIDLRAAELAEPVTTVTAVAYKSRIEILVPPGVRIEIGGIGVSKGWSAEEAWESQLPNDAPVVHVKGAAYKGMIEVRTKPSERDPGR